MHQYVSVVKILTDCAAFKDMEKKKEGDEYTVDIKFKDGHGFCLTMSKDEIIKQRDRLYHPKSLTVWNNYFDEMCFVFIIKKMCKDHRINHYFLTGSEN